MKKLLFLLLLAAAIHAHGQKITAYEYWIDDLYGSKVTTSIVPARDFHLQTQFQLTSLADGFHLFNMRFIDSTNCWSSTLTQYFMKYPVNSGPGAGITRYEYWIDDAYSARISQNITQSAVFQLTDSLNIGNIPAGFHLLNIRFVDNSGNYSATLTQYFMKCGTTGPNGGVTNYEWWIDDNFAGRISQAVSPGTTFHLADSLNLSSVPAGFHLLNIRFRDQRGQWSSVLTQYFMNYANAVLLPHHLTSYRFWFDSDFSTVQTLDFSQPSKNIRWTDTIQAPFLAVGQHLVHYQFREANEAYSVIRTDTFNVLSCLPYSGHQITGSSLVNGGQTGVIYTIYNIRNASMYHWSVPEGATIVSGATTNSITVDFGVNAVSGLISVYGSNSCGNSPISIFPVAVNQVTGITNVGFNSNWYGTAHVFPNEGCPAWTLEQNTVPVMPVFSGDSLLLNAPSADKYMDYTQSGSLVAPGDTFVCEFRMRFVSGDYGDPAQRAAGVFIRFSNNNYVKLMIGKDEFFLWNANNSKGISVFAETDDLFHTYRIEVMNKTSIRVFYDGNLALTGTTVFGSSGEKEITFGKLSGDSYGQSKWLWFRHNASTQSSNSQIALLQPVNQAVDMVLNPTLSWLASGCVTGYHLQCSDNSSFDPLIFNDSLLTTTSKQISGLVKGTTYYWRVRGTGYGNTNPWSETWHFRTHTDTLIVSGTKTISMDTTFAYVRVTSTGLLIANNVIHVTGDLLVQPGGTITHDIRNMAGLRLNVDDSLVVESGGCLNTDGKGLLGGPGGSVRAGESYDLATGNIIRITPEAGGGCHGGLGGGIQPPAYIYGNEMNPEFFGSGGGGGAASSGQAGGNGGGKIFLNAGSLILHGSISANGQSGPANAGNPGGGGGGGTVKIDAGTVSGTGTIHANGGSSGNGSGAGGGGGGRIALFYGVNNFAGILMAKGGIKNGSGYSAGSAGTIFTKSVDDSVGTLTIDNDNIEPGNIGVTLISTPGPRSYKTAQVKNKGELTVTTGVSPLTCQNQFLAGNLSKITINANASISASPLQITTSTLQIPAGYQLNQKTLVTGATINCGDTLKLLNDTLSGTATVNGSFRNQGVLIPGIPTGTMTVNGKYVQKTDGVLIIDIGGKNPGVNFDLLSVSGQATLSGTLKINLINNFLPAIGDSFSILTCGSRIGQFVTVTGWDNYKVLYRSNRVTLLRIENINHPPVARAGMDRGYTAAYPVMLDGTGSYDPDTDPITFHWISPPGITLSDSTAVNPTFISPVTLTIQVLTFVLRVNDGFVNSAPDTVILTIYPPPLLTVQAQANPKVICPGGSSQLTAYPSGGFGNYTYLWSSQPAGFTSTQRTPVVAPAVNTMYTVQLSDGVSTTQASVTVTIQSNQPTGAISNLTPADSNFQVQPPLIFRWSKVLNASSYDFYLWKTTQSKPNIPTFAGMTDTMVYFPTYFNPYHIYKWQVVAKNFCNPDTTASPVHVCSFNFFSDLTVSNISHPDTVTAGTAAAVTFTVINSGIGGTGYGYWRDILYISDTPVFNSSSAIILGDWDNVSSLAAGAVYSRSVTVTMRSYFEGPYYLFLKTDYSEKVQETNEINNLVRSVGAIYIKQPPYPDLYVHDVQPLSVKVVPDSSFEVSWIVENIGNLAAVGGFSQKVTLVSGAKRTILGFKQDPEPLPVGTVLTQSAVFTVPKGLGFESDAKVEVQLIPYSWLVEKLNATANNVALSDQSIPVMKRMFINLTLPTIYENGTWPYQCILTRSGNTEADLTVNLVNSEPGRISVPLTATIPANQSEGYFWLSAINNSLVDGNTLVTVSAGALGYPGKSAQITVIDDEIPSVMLQLSKMQAMEGDTVRVKVSRDLVTGSPLMVHLTPGAYSQVTLPNTVTIPAGKDSVVLMMPVVNDNAPELTINVTITAWVYGYNSGVQTLTILDNDIPQIQFTISPRIASEGNGIYAAIATIKRIVPGNGTNTIRLIPSVAGQLILPAEISLPFNVMQKQFNVGIIDNNLVDGNRTVKVTASVYIPNCGCGAPVSSGGTITDSLTILDNDGPSVNISAIPGTVPEGLDTAGSLVVYRNTLGGPEITVDLSNNSPGELTIPSSVVIPAGLDSVSVPFASIDDTIQDGDQIALLTATASGYANGASFVIVTDRNMPDLVIQNFQTGLSTAAITKAVPVSLTLKNQGFAVAAYGVEIRYFLSRDNVLDERDLLISSQITSNAIPIGETLQIQDTLVTPGRIGNQFLIAIVNKNQEINELVYYNNTSNSLPITVIPDYNATVSVDGEIFDGNSPILISGSAITVDNQPAIQKPIDVYVVVNGVRRDIRTTTDTNGLITVQFQPLNGEAGNYYVGACFPEQRLNTPQDNFIVLGMKYIGEQIRWDTYLGESRQGTMAVKNFSSVDLTGVDISVVSGPPGCSLTFDPIGNLAGNDTVTVNYQLDATGLSAGTSYQMVKLKINCSEGADYDFIAWFYCVAPTGRITTSPGSLVSKMIKGQSTIKEFQIQNIGNGGTGTIRVTIPQVPWMTMVSTDTIASLAPYGTAIASIRLTPTDDLPLNVPVSGGLAINCENANSMMEPYVFEAISLETGDLFVDVTDEYTFYTASGAHVDSAHVILKHPYTGVVIAQGLTNENGTILMTNIPEGNYTLVVEAANHSGYLQNVFIEKGKVNEKSVFISFQPVTYSWNVVPTQIQDHYEITLIVEFVTNVPAPVVLLDMPDSMPHLENNETYPFIVTVTNMGLITAQDLHLQFPDDPEYEFVNMMDNVNVLPQQALQIPVVMKRRETNKSGGLNCLYFVFASCSFECGANHQYQTSVHTLTFNTRICTEPEASLPSTPGPDISCSECPPPDPGVAAGGGPPVYPTWPILFNIEIGESSCDPCMQEIGKFLLDQACEIFAANPLCEIYEVLGCYNSIVEGCGDENGIYSMNCAEALWDCFGELPEGMQTAFDFAKLCQPKPEGKSPFAMSFLPTLQANMQIAYDEMAAMKIWRTEFFGDSAWVYCNETEFIYFRNYFDSISQMDTVSVTPELLTHRPTNISTDQVASFAARWNSTLNRENGLPYDTANVINFNIIEDSYEIIDSCEKLSVQAGYASTSVLAQAQMDSLRYYYERESGSVCAKVSLKFSQSMTMTREAFDGTLTINNGHETDPIENILLELVVKNEAGENSNDLFQINTLSMNELTGINGTGILGPKKSGTAIVRFIPEKGAAPTVARFYSFGGNLSYKDPYTGEIVTRPLYPVRLQVNPGPDLYLDYFMQRDILGDNAITPAIEPSIPAELGVMINNKGAGAAYGVDLESSQPVIIDNEKGLLVDFRIIGSNLGGHPRHLGLYDVIFGNIGAGKTAVGQWWFTSSLLGHFVSYSASVNHLDSYGNRDLSLVSSVKIHELIHGIMAYGALYDTIGDFLVNEIPDGNDTPDHIFFSNGTDTDVSLAKNVWIDNPVTIWDTTVHLTVEPKIPGWNYTKINDPGAGLYRIASVIRNDGQVIPLENMWLTYCTIPDGADPIYEDKLHFTDLFISFDTIGYNVVFEPVDQDPPAVDSILGIPDAATEIPVDSVDIRFSEPIVDTTFTFADMTLRCQGGPNLMDSSMVIMKISDTVYRVFFGGSTIMNGYYTLIVQASGVSDFSGNFGKEGKMVGWIQASSVPAISQFIGLPVTPGAPIDSLLILFNMPVYDSTFTVDDLELIKNQIDTLSVSSLIITPADPDHLLFRITGLSQETGADGNYKLNVMVTSIYARNGQHGLTDQAASWSVCQTAPPTAFAGNNDTTCSNMLYQLSGNVTNASSFSWSSTGSGTFYNSGSLTPTYQPSTADISAGSVMITLSAFASGNCAASAVSLFRLVIVKAPYAYAGNSVTLMSGEPYLLSGSVALNTSSITWTTSGTGQFSDDHILHPVYTPAPADTGTVTLTLTVAGYYSCEPVSSFLTINYLPPAYPVIQASGLVFSNPDTAKITLNWNDGNGMKRSVFMKQDTAGYPIPEMTGNYVGNPLFGAGSQINSSGWFCIFDGTTHLQGVVVTGLQPGMTYRLMVCEYNEYFGMRYYQQQGASQNPLNRQVCPISIPQISGETTGCAGNALNFSTETGMNEYSWSLLPDGLINSGSGTASILAVWNTSGNKSLKVSYHLPNGCPSSWKHHLVIINPLPSGAGVIQGPGSVCAGVAGIMYSIPAINNAQSYQWTVPAGCTIIQGQGSASVTVNFPVNLLTDVISVTGMNACGAGISSSLQVSVYAPLTGLVNLQGITVHAGENFCYTGAKITTAGTGTIYVIQNGGQATMIAADTVRLRSGTKVSSGGKLLASVTQNCIPCNTSKSVVFVSGQPESTAETMNQAERLMPFFRAYPNPVSDDLTVELLDQRVLSSVVHIQILNLLGDKIYQTEMIAEFRKKISLQGWNAGVYLLRVSDGAQSGIMKVVR